MSRGGGVLRGVRGWPMILRDECRGMGEEGVGRSVGAAACRGAGMFRARHRTGNGQSASLGGKRGVSGEPWPEGESSGVLRAGDRTGADCELRLAEQSASADQSEEVRGSDRSRQLRAGVESTRPKSVVQESNRAALFAAKRRSAACVGARARTGCRKL